MNGIYQPPIVLTYNEILQQYGDALLSSLLISNLMFLTLSVYITQYTASWQLRSWKDVLADEKPDGEEIAAKGLRLIGWICLPASLFFSLMLIAYKMGIVI